MADKTSFLKYTLIVLSFIFPIFISLLILSFVPFDCVSGPVGTDGNFSYGYSIRCGPPTLIVNFVTAISLLMWFGVIARYFWADIKTEKGLKKAFFLSIPGLIIFVSCLLFISGAFILSSYNQWVYEDLKAKKLWLKTQTEKQYNLKTAQDYYDHAVENFKRFQDRNNPYTWLTYSPYSTAHTMLDAARLGHPQAKILKITKPLEKRSQPSNKNVVYIDVENAPKPPPRKLYLKPDNYLAFCLPPEVDKSCHLLRLFEEKRRGQNITDISGHSDICKDGGTIENCWPQ